MSSSIEGLTAPVSVIIPVHNGADTVSRAIASLRHQEVQAAEVIVVDDASTDESAALARASWPDGPVSVVNSHDRGSASARNTGVAVASQPYIAFLDCDDVWYPAKLARQMPLVHEPEVLYVGALMHYLSPTGRVLGSNDRYPDFAAATGALRRAESMPLALSSIILRRERFMALGGFDEAFRRSQDFEFCVRLAQMDGLVVWPVKEILLGYVVSAGAATATSYGEQAAAAELVRYRLQHPDEQTAYRDFVGNPRLPSRALMRARSGRSFRLAAVALNEGRRLQAAQLGAAAVVQDPAGVLRKLRWGRVRQGTPPVPAEIAQLFTAK